MLTMRPRMGARFTWQLKTFMKTEMRSIGAEPRFSSAGGTTICGRHLAVGGRDRRSSSCGVMRSGSRKK